MLLLPGSQGIAGAGVGEIPDGHRWDAPPKRTPPPGADAIDGATVLGIIGRQISKLAERAKKAPPDDRGCGRQITSSRPAFVHVKGAPGCGNRSPELGASPRRGGNGHRWTALLELRRKHIEIASDADRLTRWFRSGPSDNPSRRERHQPRHGKSGSHETRRWRERDSNPRSPVSEGSGLAHKMIVDFDLDKLRSTDPPRG
jgi:hypothetical protein